MNILSKTESIKPNVLEKNNKNLKNLHQKFTTKINLEATNVEENRNIEKGKRSLNSMRMREKLPNDKNSSQGYIKTEPCYVSNKKNEEEEILTQQNNRLLHKPKKKSRVNKVYSLQPTINSHLKSKLDHKNGSIGTTEEEFESEEISEGNIDIDEINRIDKIDISEGVVYGKGGIPIKNQKQNFSITFSAFEKENKDQFNNVILIIVLKFRFIKMLVKQNNEKNDNTNNKTLKKNESKESKRKKKN